MARQQLSGYENEPREHFQPLPPDLYNQLYHYERLSRDLAPERSYYRHHLQGKCSRVLELGCGSCLLSDNLHRHGFQATGIDISREILLLSKKISPCPVAQMDMCRLGFQPGFEAALMAQNTLNLLLDEKTITNCLRELKRILIPPGLLLAHLYCVESEQMAEPDEKLLQFYLFDHPQGGKIIKETIRFFDPGKKSLTLDQRYKIRRFSTTHQDKNYRQTLQLAAFPRYRWLKMFTESGFSIVSTASNFSDEAQPSGSTLHLVARSFNT